MSRVVQWLRANVCRFMMAVIALVGLAADACATGPASCTALSGAAGATPPTFANMVGCCFDTLGVYAVIAALLVVILPLVLIVWGSRSGMSLISSLFRKAAGALGRH